MRKNTIIILLSTIIVIAGGIIAYGIYNNETKKDQAQQNNQSVAREEAIREAEEFEPAEGVMCIQVLTPAVHRETGAAYTFTTGCLPDGWERVDAEVENGPSLREAPNDNDDDRSSDAQSGNTSNKPAASNSVRTTNPTPRTDDTKKQQQYDDAASIERDAIIAEARRWQPPRGTKCTTVMTPARHIKTGIVYTFSSGCIPDGWERINPRGAITQ